MRRLRVSVQAGLTPGGLGPRPGCSSAGWRIDGLHSGRARAFCGVARGTDEDASTATRNGFAH